MLVAEGDRCLSLEMIVVMVDDWWQLILSLEMIVVMVDGWWQLILSLEMIVVMVDGWWRSMPVADDDRSDG
jgi:hypothetical protein